MNSQKRGIRYMAVVGGLIVTLLLVLSTFWMGRNATQDTETAVRKVSSIYLDELTGRREQVVAATLSDYINDMNMAISLMEKDDLSSVERLQAYQARMKQFYNLEKFAFIDVNGLIYTSRGTRTDIDKYPFKYGELTEPVIAIKNPDSSSKKVIIAMPVDRLPFNGTNLIVCFIEFDMNKMLENISLQSGGDNTTFCNLYTNSGNSLTNTVLGGLAGEKNLLAALEEAQFEEGYSLEKMREDFKNKRGGVVSFTYKDIRETMSYLPVHGTDWMLTYLVRESIISGQISSIYEGIVSRSLIQSLLTVFVLVVLFAIMLMQTRKASKMLLEKEISETENRVKQQELEEQLALQEELLAQEQQRVRQDRMITALASDYRSVYYVNLDEDLCICYRTDGKFDNDRKEGEQFSFRESFLEYAHNFVAEEYREGFLALIMPEVIRENLSKNKISAYRYLVRRDDKETYEMIRMAGVGHKDGETDGEIHAVGIGFTDIDDEMRDTLNKSQALSDALKAAEDANKAKTIFLSNMSHEIRTPMNAIIGLDNLAMHEPNLSEKSKDYLDKIGNAARHLLSIINDILDMSRIESGKMVLRKEEFNFAGFIEHINNMFSSQCREKGLTYNCYIHGTVDEFYIGDNIKLRQVLMNILSNAVKFTPEGGTINLLVEKINALEGKSTLRFVVKDTGIGMSKEFLPKIFDTFSQENSGASNKYGSSGLGMAITKNIVEMMNGKIEVESEKDVGTEFTVVVTLMDADNKHEIEEDIGEISLQNLRVLVVDDDSVACQHAALVLEKAGIAATIALSGEEAYEMVKLCHARREPYNLIIVDWKMPDPDGVELTRRIRSDIGDESAIIMLTAYNWEEIADEAIAAGVDSFISKPLFSGNLLEEFKHALKKRTLVLHKTREKADLAGRKILLAEDMVVNAEIMMEVLKMREMEPEHAENGKIATEMFASHPEGYYSAILMDMRMPEMDGLTATTTIRAMERGDAKTIPIIALTANAFDEDVQRSLQAGLNAHLSKPVDPEVLFETLENLIK